MPTTTQQDVTLVLMDMLPELLKDWATDEHVVRPPSRARPVVLTLLPRPPFLVYICYRFFIYFCLMPLSWATVY